MYMAFNFKVYKSVACYIVLFTKALSFIPKASVFLLLKFLFQKKELEFFFLFVSGEELEFLRSDV